MARPDSAILKYLRLGVALHHGALPTAYRKEVECLLRDNVPKVTISSPTLAHPAEAVPRAECAGPGCTGGAGAPESQVRT
jgi:hypothetical protein